jgi:hypothetical protein
MASGTVEEYTNAKVNSIIGQDNQDYIGGLTEVVYQWKGAH